MPQGTSTAEATRAARKEVATAFNRRQQETIAEIKILVSMASRLINEAAIKVTPINRPQILRSIEQQLPILEAQIVRLRRVVDPKNKSRQA